MGLTAGPPPEAWEKAAQLQSTDSAAKVNAQTNTNRPDQNTPFAQQQWSQGPDGAWTQNTSLTGGMGSAVGSLQNQYGQAMQNPFSFGQFGEVGTGDQARDQAINAAYGQASSRLDPQWNQREDQTRTRLMNQGLDPTSEAYKNEMGGLGQQRNDAYMGAMNSAIGQGTAAGNSVFQNNMMSRQQAISEALKGRGLPMEELMKTMPFTLMPQFNQGGRGETTQWMQALNGMNGQAAQQQQQGADVAQGAASMAIPLMMMMMSDERAKTNVNRLKQEALPGVPFATWNWKEDPGGKINIGVIAQDLEKVAPQYVSEREDGMKMVDYSFLGKDK